MPKFCVLSKNKFLSNEVVYDPRFSLKIHFDYFTWKNVKLLVSDWPSKIVYCICLNVQITDFLTGQLTNLWIRESVLLSSSHVTCYAWKRNIYFFKATCIPSKSLTITVIFGSSKSNRNLSFFQNVVLLRWSTIFEPSLMTESSVGPKKEFRQLSL